MKTLMYLCEEANLDSELPEVKEFLRLLEKTYVLDSNWKLILDECREHFGRTFINDKNEECIFDGVICAADDYYYVLFNNVTRKYDWLSCVGNLDAWDLKLK